MATLRDTALAAQAARNQPPTDCMNSREGPHRLPIAKTMVYLQGKKMQCGGRRHCWENDKKTGTKDAPPAICHGRFANGARSHRCKIKCGSRHGADASFEQFEVIVHCEASAARKLLSGLKIFLSCCRARVNRKRTVGLGTRKMPPISLLLKSP